MFLQTNGHWVAGLDFTDWSVSDAFYASCSQQNDRIIYACMVLDAYQYKYTCKSTHTHKHKNIYIYIYIYIHIYIYTHTCIHAYMHTCIHAYMHACMHACMHTYMHILVAPLPFRPHFPPPSVEEHQQPGARGRRRRRGIAGLALRWSRGHPGGAADVGRLGRPVAGGVCLVLFFRRTGAMAVLLLGWIFRLKNWEIKRVFR